MIDPFVWIILFAFLVDGIKTLLETFVPYRSKEFTSNHDEVSVVIPLYNKEERIQEVLSSVLEIFPANNVYVVDDCSTDNSREVVRQQSDEINLIELEENQGKVSAIEKGFSHINTDFTLLLDADTILPRDFQCPTSLLNGEATAIAFNVLPIAEKKSLILDFQLYEYVKSMTVGKKFQDRAKSVQCISGAAGLFKTDRLKELSSNHTKIFSGEDLERTLLELVNNGEVIFVDQKVWTYAPNNIGDLLHQRCAGWWPGSWRTIPLSTRILFRKGPALLKWETLYNLFAFVTDAFKIASLIYLIWIGSWQLLSLLFFIYIVLELVVYTRIRAKNEVRKIPISVVYLYFFYGLTQVVLRVIGLGVLVSRLARKKSVVAYSLLILILAGVTYEGKAQDSDFTVSAGYEYIQDSSGRTIDNINLGLQYKLSYLRAKTAQSAPQYLLAGTYIELGGTSINPSLLLKKHGQTARVRVQRQIGDSRFVGKIGSSYHSSPAINNFPTSMIGLDVYWGSYTFTTVNLSKDYGRGGNTRVTLKNNFRFSDDVRLRLGGAVNNLGDLGFFGRLNMWHLYLSYSSYENFDYANFDRRSFSVGVQLEL